MDSATHSVTLFHRYVALGDSGTEGVGDEPHPDGSERGWADRLAEHLAQANPQLLYANLAVRGRRLAEIHEQQRGRARSGVDAWRSVGRGRDFPLADQRMWCEDRLHLSPVGHCDGRGRSWCRG